MGVSHQAVTRWRKRGAMPIERALVAEQLFGVPRVTLVSPAVAEALTAPEQTGDSIL